MYQIITSVISSLWLQMDQDFSDAEVLTDKSIDKDHIWSS